MQTSPAYGNMKQMQVFGGCMNNLRLHKSLIQEVDLHYVLMHVMCTAGFDLRVRKFQPLYHRLLAFEMLCWLNGRSPFLRTHPAASRLRYQDDASARLQTFIEQRWLEDRRASPTRLNKKSQSFRGAWCSKFQADHQPTAMDGPKPPRSLTDLLN